MYMNGFVGWQHDIGLVKCRQMDNSQRVAIACFPLQRNAFSSCPAECSCEPMDPFEKWIACCALQILWKLSSFTRMWMVLSMCINGLSYVYSLHPRYTLIWTYANIFVQCFSHFRNWECTGGLRAVCGKFPFNKIERRKSLNT